MQNLIDQLDDMKLDAANAQSLDVEEMLRNMAATRRISDKVAELSKGYKALLDNYKKIIVPAFFQERGIGPIVVDAMRFSVSTSSRTSIPAKNKPAAYQWLRDNGLEDLITETVNSGTLSATGKSLLEDGIEMPGELFEYYAFENTSMTKIK
tara:strand:- start:348 stop:803 length:456 start_codon:yes stop_codon:yes gene_type:complete